MRYSILVVVAGCGRVGFDVASNAPADPAPLTYTATVADCIDPIAPDPTACMSNNGLDQLVVDGRDGTTTDPWQSYVRFELDTQLAGRTLVSVRLVMTATDNSKANGPDSGEVWRVEPFDRSSLATRTPATLGPPLDRSQGAVGQGDVVEWELPVETVSPGAPLCLGVITTSQTGGVNYWNLSGANPPRLEIETD